MVLALKMQIVSRKGSRKTLLKHISLGKYLIVLAIMATDWLIRVIQLVLRTSSIR